MYDVEPDPYCYPGSDVLRNKLGLTEADDLEAFEADAVTQRADEPLPEGDLSSRFLRDIHHHLFQDVYDWAGEYRVVRIAKVDSVFCYPERIADQAGRPLDLERLNPETFLAAMIAAFNANEVQLAARVRELI